MENYKNDHGVIFVSFFVCLVIILQIKRCTSCT